MKNGLNQIGTNVLSTRQRKFFYFHKQEIPANKWNIVHGFGLSNVIVVYDKNGFPIDPKNYKILVENGSTTITFSSEFGEKAGSAHVITRTGGATNLNTFSMLESKIQISYDGIMTFATPRYITRLFSGTSPIAPPSLVAVTPTPQPTPLPSDVPYDICANIIRVEIEVTRPNEPTVTCVETLDTLVNQHSPWIGWPQILVKSRKHYCVKTIDIKKLKVFANTNDQKLTIPDGTVLRILRIDYGSGVLVNIPDRGLLVLLANSPYRTSDKILDKLIDCGELVGAQFAAMTFQAGDLFADANVVETTYPNTTLYNKK